VSEWSQFAEQHWTIGGIVASLLWFLAGRQSLTNRQPGYALFWQAIAVFIVAVLCVWALLERQWIALGFGIAVLCMEAFSMSRSYAARRGHRDEHENHTGGGTPA
jgi:energy-converting hydrogenase Eha subunit B